MIHNGNPQNNPVMESITKQFDMVGNSKNILNLGGPLISNLLSKNDILFSEIKQKLNLKTSDYFDKLSTERLWINELPDLENKFDLIILHDLLEQTKKPKLLLENLSNYLSNDGSIIATIKNFLYLENTCRIFAGILPQSNLNIYDLNSLNLFLNHENFVVSELSRNQKKFDFDSNSDLNEFDLPSDVLEFLRKNPESEVISYVFRIKKKILVDLQTRKWISTFSKNYFLEHLKNKFDYYQNLEQTITDKDDVIIGLEKSLNETKSYLEQTIKDKDDVIIGLEKSLMDSNSYLEKIIKDKDDVIIGLEKSLNETKSYLEQTIKDKDAYLEQTINDYKEQINNIKTSKSWKLLHKFDKNND